uniref:Mitochondrial cytochrome c oxidase subunit VIc/VIIs domain-containing protein n=1 Tax=Acrobeloides nanus TaxID=290746 RepID=A0A914DYV5_9BILA
MNEEQEDEEQAIQLDERQEDDVKTAEMSKPQLRDIVINTHRRFFAGHIAISLLGSALFGIVAWRWYKKEGVYFDNYDAYKHFEILCRAQQERGVVWMKTCPHELAKKWKDAGKAIAPLAKSDSLP